MRVATKGWPLRARGPGPAIDLQERFIRYLVEVWWHAPQDGPEVALADWMESEPWWQIVEQYCQFIKHEVMTEAPCVPPPPSRTQRKTA